MMMIKTQEDKTRAQEDAKWWFPKLLGTNGT